MNEQILLITFSRDMVTPLGPDCYISIGLSQVCTSYSTYGLQYQILAAAFVKASRRLVDTVMKLYLLTQS